MSKIKKVLLGISVALIMAIAFVVGIVGLNQDKPHNTEVIQVKDTNTEIKTPQKPTRPVKKEIIFKPGEVSIQRGGGKIEFSYTPDNVQGATSKAYEYKFSNPMSDTMAVNLDSIDTTGVTVSYAYSDTPLTKITSTNTLFEAQTIGQNKTKYIYIVVTSDSAIPTTFKTSIFWWQGRAGSLTIHNQDGSVNITLTIVKGQKIDEPYIELEDDEEIEGWYLDAECTIPADLNSIQSATLYPKTVLSNLPSDWLAWDSSANSYYVTTGTSTLQADLVIPRTYNDGTHGKADVTRIAEYAFEDNEDITSVILPNGITEIEYGAFWGAIKLARINLVNCNSLTSIGAVAFCYCESLTTINMPSDITNIGEDAFKLSGLTSIDLSKCNKLTRIENNTFKTSELDTIFLPNNLISIGDNAFYGCDGLTSINLPSSLTGIGAYAFHGCSGLTSINLPSSLTSISEYAFYGCSALTSVTLPSNLISIGYAVFSSCSGLTSIVVESGNTVYDSRNNCNAIIETSTNTLIMGCKNTVIPNNVTSIDKHAFRGIGLIGINIPSSVTNIGDYAFHDCSGLTEITIPANVIKIGPYAFRGCTNLTSITFSDTSTWYRTNNLTNWESMTGGTSTSVTNATQNATRFVSTSGYYNYYWYKI